MKLHSYFPDKQYCRTRCCSGTLWECLAENAEGCEYLVTYGPERYCINPYGAEFALKGATPKK